MHAVFAAGNILIGVLESSWWFLTAGIYYAVLGIARLILLARKNRASEAFFGRFTGRMLMLTSLPLLGTAILCSVRDVGTKFHEIVMISMALYAFSKVTLAILHLVKANKETSPIAPSLRGIALADALVSIASLQRSMLVSFGEMSAEEIRLFNALTSIGVSLLIFLLGAYFLKKTNRNT